MEIVQALQVLAALEEEVQILELVLELEILHLLPLFKVMTVVDQVEEIILKDFLLPAEAVLQQEVETVDSVESEEMVQQD